MPDSGLAIPAEVHVDREMCARSLKAFVEAAWPMVEPGRPFMDNWHIDAICEHLQAVSEGEITRLLINVPPACMKSLLVCVFWPTWEWTLRPEMKWIYASYAASLSRRDALRSRRIMESPWFRQRWGHMFDRKEDEWTATRYVNNQGGLRLSTSVGGMVTGDHGDRQVIDDPLKPADVTGSLRVSKGVLEKSWNWYTETMATRLVDFKRSARVVIMQRLHEGDLAGRILKEGGYDYLCLPMEYEVGKRTTSIGFQDPRTEPDELLWPDRFDESAVAKLKEDLGSRGAAAQLQQRPSPRGGNIFKRQWFNYYYTEGHEHLASEGCVLLPSTRRQVQAWDCAFKGTDISDYVVGQVWGAADDGQRYFLLDQFRERTGFSGTIRAVQSMAARWPKAVAKLVEDAANGPAVVDALRDRIAGFQLVSAAGGKEARASSVEPLVESGAVYLPHPSICPWVSDLIEELCVFPSGSHDDQVDAFTHALTRLHLGGTERYIAAMRRVKRSA